MTATKRIMGRRAKIDSKLHNFPEKVLIEILLNLPVKSLLRFKTVSKSWYSLITNLINNPTFIQAHLKNSSRNSFIILSKKEGFSIHHDNTSLLEYTEPKLPSHILNPSLKIHGSSNGLICLSNDYTIYLWNPALRKLKTLPKSLIAFDSRTQNYYETVSIAFGFHAGVNDYKVVRIFIFREDDDEDSGYYYISEVYSLRRDCWKRIEVGPSSYFDDDRKATVNGAAYWIGARSIKGLGIHGSRCYRHHILRFEMGEEVFGEVSLPEVALHYHPGIKVLGESELCLLPSYGLGFSRGGCGIWTMEYCGEVFCWTKRYTTPNPRGKARRKPLGFRKSGELLVNESREEEEGRVLSYDFEKKMVRGLGICGDFDNAYSYVESLIQLDGAESLFFA